MEAGATRFFSFDVYKVLLRKYIIFSLFSVLEGFKKLVIMGRRALGASKTWENGLYTQQRRHCNLKSRKDTRS
jgi:hypothetical protein